MKTWKLFGLMLLLAAGFAACSDDEDNVPGDGPGGNPADSVAVGDTTVLPPITLDNNAGKFWEVLRQVQPEYGMAMGKTVISDAGFEAFREEADGWCQGLETDVEKMDTIFKMVHNSLRQQSVSDQSPEEVWKNKAGICQGFADVFKVLEGETGQQITANIIEIFSNIMSKSKGKTDAMLNSRIICGNFPHYDRLKND